VTGSAATGTPGTIESLETELGPARMFSAVPADTRLVLLLGHGAGGGVDAPDLEALTRLSNRGVAVLRFEQPWRTAGKKVAPVPTQLDRGWRAARAYVRTFLPDLPLVLGGRSAGARVACRSAATDPEGVLAVVALSFPLHPPGKPESSRAPELLAPDCPVLVVQGERDPFGTPAEMAVTLRGVKNHTVVPVPGCRHEFRPAKRGPLDQAAVAELLVSTVAEFLDQVHGRDITGEAAVDRE